MWEVVEEHAARFRGTALGKQASGRTGQDAAVGFDGSHAMPGQGRGPAPLAHQGPQSRQGGCPDGDKVRTGLLPDIGRGSVQALKQLIQHAVRWFASLPQLEEFDEPGMVGRQKRRV